MHCRKLIFASVFVLLSHSVLGQESILYEDQFTELTSNADRLSAYIDTASKYMYQDVDISVAALSASAKIIASEPNLHDSLIFKYKFEKIYHELNMLKNLEALKTVMECETELNWEKLTDDHRSSFNYIKGFTFMIFGDLEASQKVYYENIVLSKKNKNYSNTISNLYSLGQLYVEEKDYDSALKCYDEALELSKTTEIKKSTLALIFSEKSEVLTHLKKYNEALDYLDKAYEQADSNNMHLLKSDILMLQGMNYLFLDEMDEAEAIYVEMVQNQSTNNDINNLVNTKQFLTLMSKEKKEYQKALISLNELISKTDSTNYVALIENYTHAHELYKELGNYKSAYEYSLATNELKNKKEADGKRQKTAYLKVKYESEEREKDNALLKSEIEQNALQRNKLYALIGLAGLLLLFLIGAFYQKTSYNKKLELEVKRRTDKLNKSNELLHYTNQELSEFNQILSHDLKEPTRIITSLSQLANKNRENPIKLKEQLSHVTDSAKQLSVLIEDVEKYRNIDHLDISKKEEVNVERMLKNILETCKRKYPNKEVSLSTENIKLIHAAPNLLNEMFKYLFDNACKFNNQETIKIHVTHQSLNGQNRFTIKDNGIGIPQKFHQHVFERFKRLNLRNEYKGTGLGLSIAKKLIEKIQGSISILDSKEDEGTTIEIAFPV